MRSSWVVLQVATVAATTATAAVGSIKQEAGANFMLFQLELL